MTPTMHPLIELEATDFAVCVTRVSSAAASWDTRGFDGFSVSDWPTPQPSLKLCIERGKARVDDAPGSSAEPHRWVSF